MVRILGAYSILSESNGYVSRKKLSFFYVTEVKVELNQNFMRSVLCYKGKAAKLIAKTFS